MLQVVIIQVWTIRPKRSMKKFVFLGYFALIPLLYFAPNLFSEDSNHKFLSGTRHQILSDTLDTYHEIKGLHPGDALNMFFKNINIGLVMPYQTICQHFKKPNPDLDLKLSDCVSTNPCVIHQSLEDLWFMLQNSNNQNSDFVEIQKAFDSMFSKKTYITLALDLVINELDSESESIEPLNEPIDDKNITKVTKLSKNVLLQLMRNVNQYSTCLGMLLQASVDGMNKVLRADHERNRYTKLSSEERIFHHDNFKRNVTQYAVLQLEVRKNLIRMVTMLCVEDFWMRAWDAGFGIQHWFMLGQMFIMIILYFCPNFVFEYLFKFHCKLNRLYGKTVGCPCKSQNIFWSCFRSIFGTPCKSKFFLWRVYNQFLGCPCKLPNFFTFQMLENSAQELKEEERRAARNRRRNRRR